MSTHRHKSVTTETRYFSGSVSKIENRAAHGYICEVETCSCDATHSGTSFR